MKHFILEKGRGQYASGKSRLAGKSIDIEKSGYNKALQNKIIEFFRDNPNPSDDKVHAFSEKIKVEPDVLEKHIYGILSDIINFPVAKESEVDSKELSAGQKVEMEHTSFPLIAKQIALSHLKEIPDYYTRLKEMESKGKEGEKDGKKKD